MRVFKKINAKTPNPVKRRNLGIAQIRVSINLIQLKRCS